MNNVTVLRTGKAFPEGEFQKGLSAARVLEVREGEYLLLSEECTPQWGRKADGCLLLPEVDDLVLMWKGGNRGTFILNVLIKKGAESHLVFEGKTTLCSRAGGIEMRGEEIEIKAQKAASVTAPTVNLKGMTGTVRFVRFSFLCREVLSHIVKASMVAETCHSVVGRLTQRIRDSFRKVERLDQTRAGSISQTAEDRFAVKAGHTVILAENDVKVDGDKIHIG